MDRKDAHDIKKDLEEKENEALCIIKKDLSEWLSKLLGASIESDTFLTQLDTGILLCQLAVLVQQQATRNRENVSPNDKTIQKNIPRGEIHYNKHAKQKTFHARDNTANFISFCRDAGVEESVLFESNGLVQHEDERRIILCILEVARIAGSLGMATPRLIELERDIDSVERNAVQVASDEGSRGKGNEVKHDGRSPKLKRRKKDPLDTKVLMIFNQCTCKRKLGVVAHGDGKFELTLPSGRKMIIFVRILSDRIMVRVGGGWDSIEHFVLKYDPCRQGISITDSTLEKEMAGLAPGVKIINMDSIESGPPIPQKKVKQFSPYATLKHMSHSHAHYRPTKSCDSTPNLSTKHHQLSPKKRKLK